MTGELSAAGFRFTPEPGAADIIIVNTCSFIASAVDESIDEILELAAFKKAGQCNRLVVTGCLPERFGKDLADALPEVDIFLGTGAYHKIKEALNQQAKPGLCMLLPPSDLPLQDHLTRRMPSTVGMAYIKATEGCDRHCTYCMIPRLRGRLRSRRMADIEQEARHLVAAGFKELVVIGQDTGCFGRDLNDGTRLSRLLERLAAISPDVWIRFLYGSPDTTDDDLIETMASHQNICAYFDIPVQHAASPVLKRMGRPYDKTDLVRLFDNIRRRIPDAALRTTLLTGFPGETDGDFEEMMEFVHRIQFDHLGVFVYSDDESLPSHRLSGHVPKKIATARQDRLMRAQQKLSAAKNQQYIGRIFPVLVEEALEPGLYAGRTMFQAPEVDGMVYVDAADAAIGEVCDVRITDALEYDLRGEKISNKKR